MSVFVAGIRPAEVPADALARLTLLRGQWRLNAFAQYERLGASIANSPIVAEHHVATSFVGVIFAF